MAEFLSSSELVRTNHHHRRLGSSHGKSSVSAIADDGRRGGGQKQKQRLVDYGEENRRARKRFTAAPVSVGMGSSSQSSSSSRTYNTVPAAASSLNLISQKPDSMTILNTTLGTGEVMSQDLPKSMLLRSSGSTHAMPTAASSNITSQKRDSSTILNTVVGNGEVMSQGLPTSFQGSQLLPPRHPYRNHNSNTGSSSNSNKRSMQRSQSMEISSYASNGNQKKNQNIIWLVLTHIRYLYITHRVTKL